MPNKKVIPDGEAWYVLDYFGECFLNSLEVIRVTKTQLVTRYGDRFRKSENLKNWTCLQKVGGNDYHTYKFRKIIK